MYLFLSYANFPITSLISVTVSIALSLIPENLKGKGTFWSDPILVHVLGTVKLIDEITGTGKVII